MIGSVVLPLTVACSGLARAGAQTAPCLHDSTETTVQQARRIAAFRYVRQVNSAEAAARGRAQRYVSLADIDNFQVPEGFQSQLSTDGVSYGLAVKDTTDPCHFAFFSDQEGVIYTGAPIR
jgi:hypothetical protein